MTLKAEIGWWEWLRLVGRWMYWVVELASAEADADARENDLFRSTERFDADDPRSLADWTVDRDAYERSMARLRIARERVHELEGRLQ